MDEQTKRCPDCDTVNPGSDFSPDRHRAGGLASKCRACDRERARRYYAAHRAERAAYYRRRAGDTPAGPISRVA